MEEVIIFKMIDTIDGQLQAGTIDIIVANKLIVTFLLEIKEYWADYDLLLKQYRGITYIEDIINDTFYTK